LIVSVGVLSVATWNIRDHGWSEVHVKAWRVFQDEERQLARSAGTNGVVVLPKHPKYGEPKIQDEYMKEYVRRMMLVQLPLLGMPIDVNDIGTFGGFWLTALLLLLALAVAREHENLCLALYKVRMLVIGEQRPDDGESRANLLYHALAMSEMLCHPPTLARGHCGTRSFGRWILHSLVFLPALVQFWVVYTSWDNWKEYEEIGNVDMPMQVTLLFLMVLLGTHCVIYLEAMTDRWRKTYSIVNPDDARRAAESWWKWIRIKYTAPRPYRWVRRLLRRDHS
jgi:hypothetical protein